MLGISGNSRAKRFIGLYALFVLFLTGYAVAAGIYDLANVFATLSLLIAAYPMWRFLGDEKRTEVLPFFAIISLIYGLYYGFSVFTTFEVYPTFEDVPRQNIVEASMLSCLGIGVLVAGYFLWPASVRIKELPPLSTYWSERKAKPAAIVFGFVGIVALVVHAVGSHSGTLKQLTHFMTNFALIAIGILFYLQLQRRLRTEYLVALWGILVPLYSVIYLSGGSTWQVIRLFIFLLLLYCAVKRTVPWRLALAAVVIIVPLLAFKHDYRATTEWATTGGARFESAQETVAGGASFVGIAGESLAQSDWETRTEYLTVVANRVDLLSTFGYVLERTPESVSYLQGESYSDVVWKFIPRALYPDKPDQRWGQKFGHLYEIIAPNDHTTSVNMPQMIETYINFGIPGLIIGMFLISQVYRFLSYLLNHRRTGEWGLITGAVILSNITNIESDFLLVFGGILQWIVLLYLVGFLVRSENRPQKSLSGAPRLRGENRPRRLVGASRPR